MELPSSLLPPAGAAPPLPMTGQLHRYARNRVAFESLAGGGGGESTGTAAANNKCILMGGLSDGLWPVPYTKLLHQQCVLSSASSSSTATGDASSSKTTTTTWSLVQPILSSSYTGFGHGSLDQDVTELDELLAYCVEQHNVQQQQQQQPSKEEPTTAAAENHSRSNDKTLPKFTLVGHSTGCQDIVHYLRHGRPDLVARIHAVVLQAPVSDREAAMVDTDEAKKVAQYLPIANDWIANGKGDECLPRNAFWAPITAQRYYDLHAKGGADDYFSSDYTDKELAQRLQHVGALLRRAAAARGAATTTAASGSSIAAADNNNMGTTSTSQNSNAPPTPPLLQTCLVAVSGADEYVPSHVNSRDLMHRLCRAMMTVMKDDDHHENRDDDDDNNDNNWRGRAVGLYLANGNHNLSSSNGIDDNEDSPQVQFCQAVGRTLRL